MGNAGKGAEECVASLCEFELGYGHVAVQVVSGDNPAKFKEQYEVHVSDRLFFNLFIFANSKAYLAQWTVPLGSQDILKKLTLCETLDIRTRITGTVSGTSWSTISRWTLDSGTLNFPQTLSRLLHNHLRQSWRWMVRECNSPFVRC